MSLLRGLPVATDDPTQFKLQICDLHSKAFPSQTILVRELLLSPMFSDPLGLAGLGSVYLGYNGHCKLPVSDDRRQKARRVPSRPRLHVLAYTLE